MKQCTEQNKKKEAKRLIKSVNFCYLKIGRSITKWETIEKSAILLSQYWKNYQFVSAP